MYDLSEAHHKEQVSNTAKVQNTEPNMTIVCKHKHTHNLVSATNLVTWRKSDQERMKLIFYALEVFLILPFVKRAGEMERGGGGD